MNLINRKLNKENKGGIISQKGFILQKICLLNELIKYKDDFLYGFYEMKDDLFLVKKDEKNDNVIWCKVIQVKGIHTQSKNIAIDIKNKKWKDSINLLIKNVNNNIISYPHVINKGGYFFSGIMKYYGKEFQSGIIIQKLIEVYGNMYAFNTDGNYEFLNKNVDLNYYSLNGDDYKKILINSLDNWGKNKLFKKHDNIINNLLGAIDLINDKVIIEKNKLNVRYEQKSITFSNIKDYISDIKDSVDTNLKFIIDLLEEENFSFLLYSEKYKIILVRNLERYAVKFKLSVNSVYDLIINKINNKEFSNKQEICNDIFNTNKYEELDESEKLWLYCEAIFYLKEGYLNENS